MAENEQLVALEAAEAALSGGLVADMLSWSQLREARLSEWRISMRSYKLIDYAVGPLRVVESPPGKPVRHRRDAAPGRRDI